MLFCLLSLRSLNVPSYKLVIIVIVNIPLSYLRYQHKYTYKIKLFDHMINPLHFLFSLPYIKYPTNLLNSINDIDFYQILVTRSICTAFTQNYAPSVRQIIANHNNLVLINVNPSWPWSSRKVSIYSTSNRDFRLILQTWEYVRVIDCLAPLCWNRRGEGSTVWTKETTS